MSTTRTLPQTGIAGSFGWRPVVLILATSLMAFSVAGIIASAPADAAVVSVAQCNGQGPGSTGATTAMNCDFTVVNTINGGVRSSVVTVSRVCALDECSGSISNSYQDVVTSVNPCNGSGTGGGGTVPGSSISPAIPIIVNQCKGTGNPGGTVVTRLASAQTITTAAAVPPTSAPPTTAPPTTAPPTTAPPTTAPPTTAPPTTGPPTTGPTTGPAPAPATGTPTPPALLGTPAPSTILTDPGTPTSAADLPAVPQVGIVPSGGIQTGGGSTAGMQHVGLLVLSTVSLLAAGCSAVVRRRSIRRG